MGTLNRPGAWLRDALQLIDARVPTELATRELVPVVDAYQDGWGVSHWEEQGTVIAAGSAAGTHILPSSANTDTLRIITGLWIAHTGGAATASYDLYFRPNNAFSAAGIVRIAVAVGAIAWWKDIAGTIDARLVVPPGWTIGMLYPATAAGETHSFRCSWQRMPAGFRGR